MTTDPSHPPELPIRQSSAEERPPESSAGDVSLEPLESPPAASPEEIRAVHLPSFEPAEYPEEPLPRFSLGELILWSSLISLAFGGLHWLRPKVLAGACGIITLAWLMILSAVRPEAKIFFVIWWALLTAYILACVIAIANG